ncbi:MAG: DUF4199 domain-containing protein [Blastocatellia bacterium]
MKTEIKWGVIFSAVQLLWLAGEYMAGLHDKYIARHPVLTMLFVIPAVLMMVLAVREKRRELGGQLDFKQAFMCGVGVSVVTAFLAPLVQFIFHRIINPGFFSGMIRYAVDNQKSTLEQAQAFFTLQSYIFQSVVGALVMGTITSLVIAAFMRPTPGAAPLKTFPIL